MIDLLRTLKDRIGRHHATIFAAAVAFFAFLALIPALTAVIGVYGLAADADDITRQLTEALSGAPASTREFLVDQMTEIASGSGGALGVSVVIGLGIALFSASGAVANLVKSLNVAYELEETRAPWTLRGVALGLTVGGVLVLSVVVFLMAALPPLLAEWGLGDAARLTLNIGRYPVLGIVMAATLSLLYRLGPDHGGNDKPLSPRAFTKGGLVATVLFVVLSLLFSFYTANLGSYGETYGPLATIIVLLVWFQLSALSIIIGAELDAELADRAWRERTGLEDPGSRTESGPAAAERLFAALAARDTDAALAVWHRRGVYAHPLFGELAVPDQLRHHLHSLHRALPDLEVRVDEILGSGDSATVRHHMEGTFTGDPWAGMEPNGRSFAIDAVAVVRVEEGHVVRVDELFDTADLAAQLGFRPGDTSLGARARVGLSNLWRRARQD